MEVYIIFQPGIFIASGTGEDRSNFFERNPVGTLRYIGFNCSGWRVWLLERVTTLFYCRACPVMYEGFSWSIPTVSLHGGEQLQHPIERWEILVYYSFVSST